MNFLKDLPDDILEHISYNYLNDGKTRLLNTCGIYSNNMTITINTKIKHNAYRIMLFYIIKHNQKQLFRKINTIFKMNFFNHIGGMIKFNDSCLMYAPVTQYGKCRFCLKQLNEHKYEKMIKIYLSLTLNS